MTEENAVTMDDLLILVGAKETQIMLLQRRVMVAQQQVENLTKALQEQSRVEKAEEPEDPNEPIRFPGRPKKGN